jgi:DNA-binding SARP family transcriptional activator/streptogramin lyase
MEFRILGPLEVVDGDRLVAIAGSKQRALLAVLLLHPNAVVSRDRLIDELWGESPPDTASTALQVHVSQLRKSLGRDVIVTRAPGYMIRVEPGELDLDRFEQLVEEARGKEAAPAAATLRDALRLWRGPPLADLDGSVALPERGQLEEQRLSALEHRIDAELELGLHSEQVPELEALVREDPLRERRRAQLMLALYRSGRQAEALDVYSKGRRLLADELGLEPGDELRRLERAILEHDPALAAAEAVEQGGREPGLQMLRRSRRVALIGAVIVVGAAAALVIALTRGSGSPPLAVAANSVAVVSPRTGKVVADVPIGGRPVAIAVGAGAVWVANADDQTVLRIDPKTFKVVKTIGGLGNEVTDIAVGFGSVWVAGGNDGTLTRIDPRLNAPERVLHLAKAGAVIPQPVFLVAAGAGSVWATGGNRVLRIDPQTNAVDGSTPAREAPFTSVGAGAGSAWAVAGNEHVLRLDATSGRITADSPLPSDAAFPVVAHGSLWLVVYTVKSQVWRLDPLTLQQTDSVSLPISFPFGLAAGDGGVLWTADHVSGRVWRIDSAESRAVRVAKVEHHPIAIAAGEGSVWIGVQLSEFKFR